MAPPQPLPALPNEVLQRIAERGGVKRFPAHAVLVNEGDQADSLYLLLQGRVKIYAGNEQGREVILTTLGAGEYFGELALDGGTRSASVMTLEPCTCAIVPGARLREFVAQHPDFAHHLILKLIHQVRRLTGSVKSLALEDVYSRIVGLLNLLAEADGSTRLVRDKLTQQDIAERVGSSREMVSRVFKELNAGGYVALEAGRIRLLKTLPAAW
jgi:CRP/FNR family cyclic AMP-dependent transcriptional regulator